MTRVHEQVGRLIQQAGMLGDTLTSLSLLEEAARIADSHNNVELGMAARESLMYTARSLMRGDVLIAAFTWVLARYDRNPSEFVDYGLLHHYRETVGLLANMPGIKREQFDHLAADMIQRHEAAGEPLRQVYISLRNIARDFGDREMAQEFHEKLKHQLTAADAWELDSEIEHCLFLEDEARALRLAEPVLRNVSRDDLIDAQILSILLIPLARAGRVSEAVRAQKRSARFMRPQQVYYWSYGKHIAFLALIGEFDVAIKLYRKLQVAALRNTDPLTQLHFFLDAIVFLDRLHEAGYQQIIATFPKTVDVPHVRRKYAVADLRNWIHCRARNLASQFDARNGNNYYGDELKRRCEWKPISPAE